VAFSKWKPPGWPGAFLDDEEGVLALLSKPFDKMVEMRRSNALDRLICLIKDCWGADWNTVYPVNAEGEMIDRNTVLLKLRALEKSSQQHIDWIRSRFGKTATVLYEDLAGFQYDDSASVMRTSVLAFSVMLEELGVSPDAKIVQQWAIEFRAEHGLRNVKRHADEIYNWKQIREAVQGTNFS